MCTIAEFQLLLLDLLKHSSKVELSFYGSAKAIISTNLLVVDKMVFVYTENRHCCLIWTTTATDVTDSPECINGKYLFDLGDQF